MSRIVKNKVDNSSRVHVARELELTCPQARRQPQFFLGSPFCSLPVRMIKSSLNSPLTWRLESRTQTT